VTRLSAGRGCDPLRAAVRVRRRGSTMGVMIARRAVRTQCTWRCARPSPRPKAMAHSLPPVPETETARPWGQTSSSRVRARVTSCACCHRRFEPTCPFESDDYPDRSGAGRRRAVGVALIPQLALSGSPHVTTFVIRALSPTQPCGPVIARPQRVPLVPAAPAMHGRWLERRAASLTQGAHGVSRAPRMALLTGFSAIGFEYQVPSVWHRGHVGECHLAPGGSLPLMTFGKSGLHSSGISRILAFSFDLFRRG